MGKIVLTQKDADFILTYIRANTARLINNYDEMIEKSKAFEEKVKFAKQDDPIVVETRKTVNKTMDEFQELYKIQSDIAVKCIELLTVGSADV